MRTLILGGIALTFIGIIGCKTSVPVRTEGDLTIRMGGNGVEGMEVMTLRYIPVDNRLMLIDSILVDGINIPFGWSNASAQYTLTSIMMLKEWDENAELVPHEKYGDFLGEDEFDVIIYPENEEPIVFDDVEIEEILERTLP